LYKEAQELIASMGELRTKAELLKLYKSLYRIINKIKKKHRYPSDLNVGTIPILRQRVLQVYRDICREYDIELTLKECLFVEGHENE